MLANAARKPRGAASWVVIATLLLASLACEFGQRPADPTPTPTQTAFLTETLATALASSTPTPQAAIPSPQPSLAPTGVVFDCSGDVQEIHLDKKINIIIIKGKKFQVSRQILAVILPRLHVGAHIQCTAKVDITGIIVIVNVVKIDNIVIVINPPKHKGDDEEDEDD